MAASNANLETLDKLYESIKSLAPSSSPDEFDKFAAFFTPDCKTWLQGMTHAGANGRKETVDKLKRLMSDRFWRVDERRVVSASVTASANGHKAFCETTKRLILHGQALDPFHETEVVEFTEDGLIKDFKLYCCWSPIASKLQDITGEGPYKR